MEISEQDNTIQQQTSQDNRIQQQTLQDIRIQQQTSQDILNVKSDQQTKEQSNNDSTLTEEQKQEELKKQQLIYYRMLSQCQRLDLDKLKEGAKDLNNYVFPLYTDEVLSKISSDIQEMAEAPNYSVIKHLTNNGITYYGDDLFILEYLEDTERFSNDDQLITYLSQYADLITRSQHQTQWYKQQIIDSKTLLTQNDASIDFQTLANIAFYTSVTTDVETKDISRITLLQLKERSIQQFKYFKLKVQNIQEIIKNKQLNDKQSNELDKQDTNQQQTNTTVTEVQTEPQEDIQQLNYVQCIEEEKTSSN